jgi:hypothetical protein
MFEFLSNLADLNPFASPAHGQETAQQQRELGQTPTGVPTVVEGEAPVEEAPVEQSAEEIRMRQLELGEAPTGENDAVDRLLADLM